MRVLSAFCRRQHNIIDSAACALIDTDATKPNIDRYLAQFSPAPCFFSSQLSIIIHTADGRHQHHYYIHSQRSTTSTIHLYLYSTSYIGSRSTVGLLVLAVQRFGVGFVIERSLVRLPVGALSSQLGQLSLPSLRGIGKSSTSLHGWD